MKTSDTIILHPSADKFEALMAFVKALKIDFEIPKKNLTSTSFSLDENIIAMLDERAKTPNHLCISEEESNRRLNKL